MKQYLFLYGVSSYDSYSPVAVIIPAENDDAAKELAKKIWEKVKSLCGYGAPLGGNVTRPKLYDLASDQEIKTDLKYG